MVVVRPFWAGDYLNPKSANRHFCVVGTTGSGKGLTLFLLMQSVLPYLATLPDQRALIYDAKQELLSYLPALAPGVKVKVLNPLDKRSCRWDIAKDVTSPVAAQQIAAILVPEETNSNNRFFSDAARHLVTGIMIALHYHIPGKWDFRDVILASRSAKNMIDLFEHCPYTEDLIVYFQADSREMSSILTTLATKLAPFEPIAALWQHTTDTFSIRDWLTSNTILLLGSDESTRFALDAINRAIFKRTTELVLAQSENEMRRTWFFLDEVREAGKLEGLARLLTKGRSKGACVVLGFQDIEGLRDVYGNNVANELIGQCGTKAILRLASPETAKWASELRGTFLRYERTSNKGSSDNSGKHSTNEGESYALHERSVAYTSEFFNLPFPTPENGLTGFYITAEGFYMKTFNPFPLLPKRDPLIRDYWLRPEIEQYLHPWTKADRDRIFRRPEVFKKTDQGNQKGDSTNA